MLGSGNSKYIRLRSKDKSDSNLFGVAEVEPVIGKVVEDKVNNVFNVRIITDFEVHVKKFGFYSECTGKCLESSEQEVDIIKFLSLKVYMQLGGELTFQRQK